MKATAKWLCVATVLLIAVGSVIGGEWVEDVTAPSQVAELSFERSGKIVEVLVKEGDIVTDGQLIARLDDEAERLQLKQLQAQAEDTIRIDAAEAKFDQAKVDLAEMKELFEAKVATQLEYDHSKLDLKIAELSLEMARFQQEQDKLKFREAEAMLKRMSLLSNMNGRVQEVLLKRGECADSRQQVFRLVKIDPLWIDVPVPTAQAIKLKVVSRKAGGAKKSPLAAESRVEVRLGGMDSPIVAGVVIFKSSEVDAGTDKLIVRVEIPNKDSLAAGLQAWVRFPSLWTE